MHYIDERVWLENLKGRDHFAHFDKLGVDRKVMLKLALKKYGVDCIHLAEYRDHWKALVNMMMKLLGFLRCQGNNRDELYDCYLLRKYSVSVS
jgi:hypothetical protein